MIVRSILAALALVCSSAALGQTSEFLDPHSEYKLAYEAQLKGDFKTALLHWENLTDSCDIDPVTRSRIVDRIRRVRPRVPVDPKKKPENTWTCLVLVYKNLDFEWADKDGEQHHVVTKMSDDDIKAVRQGMDNFADLVLEYSSRELRIEYDFKIVDRKLTDLVGDYAFWLAPSEMEKDMEDMPEGAYDNVFGFVKFQQEKDGPSIPGAFGGGAMGSDAGPKGCGYVNILLWAASFSDEARNGEIELHEWLHNIDWMFTAVQGYPDDICPNPDHGRMEGQFGGDPDFRRTPEMKNWLPYYEHMMIDHVTRRMWRNASMQRVADTPWSGFNEIEWLVLGPFEKSEKRDFSTPFINEGKTRPKDGMKAGGKAWKKAVSERGVLNFEKVVGPEDNVVAYAHVYLYSDKEQRAQVHIGSDDGAALWHNGTMIYHVEIPRGLRVGENVIDVMLAEGWNSFLFKVDEIAGGWALSASFTDTEGKVLEGTRLSPIPD